MKICSWFGGIIVAALTMSAGSALGAPPPDGSYQDSCKTVRASGGVLRARCERRRGRWGWARLERYSSCVGDISNYNGQLICLRKLDLPGGRWSDTCIDPHLIAPGVFGADCRSLRGGRIASEIALDRCREGLMNARGHLACEKAQQPAPQDRASNPSPQQDGEQPSPPAAGQPLPAGSYQQSCRNADFDGRYLSGECRDRRGAWQDTSLDTRSCSHDQEIGNNDGVLVCTRSERDHDLPAGSYSQTCRKFTFDGRFLSGECHDARGSWDKATLDTHTCRPGDEIANDDGELVCPRNRGAAPAGSEDHGVSSGQGGQSGAPNGGGATNEDDAASLTLYENVGFEGTSKTFRGDAANLEPLGWNDLASSLQVRGNWEVCVDVNFAGRCQLISEDQPNLADIGMNDRISSLWRVK